MVHGARGQEPGGDQRPDQPPHLLPDQRSQPRPGAGRALDWEAADAHCRALSLAGHADWRLPEVEELLALYDEPATRPCGEATCGLGAPLTIASPYVWSATSVRNDRRYYVDFRFGSKLAPRIRPALTRRALCVRSISGDAGR